MTLDASAVLALLKKEKGYEKVQLAVTNGAFMSAVNYIEVMTKLIQANMPSEAAQQAISVLNLTIVPLDADMALSSAKLYLYTRTKGLSLGDRACLALGLSLGQTVLTTDKAWENLLPNLDIQLLR